MLPLLWRHFMGKFLFSAILNQINCIWQNGCHIVSEWRPLYCAVPRCWTHHVSFPSLIFRTNVVQKPPLRIHMNIFWCAPRYKKKSWYWRTCIWKYLFACAKWEVWNVLHRSANKPCKLQAGWAFTLIACAVSFVHSRETLLWAKELLTSPHTSSPILYTVSRT